MTTGDPRLKSLKSSFLLLEKILENVLSSLLETLVERLRAELNKGIRLWPVFKTYISTSS
jgi:hypothetical protein